MSEGKSEFKLGRQDLLRMTLLQFELLPVSFSVHKYARLTPVVGLSMEMYRWLMSKGCTTRKGVLNSAVFRVKIGRGYGPAHYGYNLLDVLTIARDEYLKTASTRKPENVVKYAEEGLRRTG